MHFETVFDIAQAGYTGWMVSAWMVSAFCLAFVALGALMFLILTKLRNVFSIPIGRLFNWVLFGRWVDWMLLIFPLLWTAMVSISSITGYVASRNALQSGAYSVIEGPVTDFIPHGTGSPL